MIEKNILGVIKDDINELVHRLNFHQEGYLRVFSLERTRKHFDDIFFSRYKSVSGSDLALVSEGLLQIISRFYHEVSDLYFYFKMTEDMPSAVSNKLSTSLKIINDIHTEFIDAVVRLEINRDDSLESDFESNDGTGKGSEHSESNNQVSGELAEVFDNTGKVPSEEILDLSVVEETFSREKKTVDGSIEDPNQINESVSIDELEDDDPPPFVK